MILFH